MTKNIVVTGATGFLGSRLVERLSSLPDIQVTATGRRKNAGQLQLRPNVTFIAGDLTNRQFTDALIRPETDVLIHCAALSSPWGRYDDFYRANVVATENLLASAKLAGVERIIHISTPSIYFDFTDRFNICEDDPLPTKLVNHYASTKLIAEQRVKESSLPYIMLRPRAIIGAGDTVIMPRIIRARQENRLRIVGNGQNTVDMTSVSNLIDAILLSLDVQGTALNQAYNITNGQPVLLWPFINDVLTKINLPLAPRKLPYPILYSVARLSEIVATLFRRDQEPVITRYGAGVLAKSCTLNIDKACRLLGYVPRQTVEEGIDEFVNWYLVQDPKLPSCVLA